MKKKYFAPISQSVRFAADGMLAASAASGDTNTAGNVDGPTFESPAEGWDTSAWGNEE